MAPKGVLRSPVVLYSKCHSALTLIPTFIQSSELSCTAHEENKSQFQNWTQTHTHRPLPAEMAVYTLYIIYMRTPIPWCLGNFDPCVSFKIEKVHNINTLAGTGPVRLFCFIHLVHLYPGTTGFPVVPTFLILTSTIPYFTLILPSAINIQKYAISQIFHPELHLSSFPAHAVTQVTQSSRQPCLSLCTVHSYSSALACTAAVRWPCFIFQLHRLLPPPPPPPPLETHWSARLLFSCSSASACWGSTPCARAGLWGSPRWAASWAWRWWTPGPRWCTSEGTPPVGSTGWSWCGRDRSWPVEGDGQCVIVLWLQWMYIAMLNWALGFIYCMIHNIWLLCIVQINYSVSLADISMPASVIHFFFPTIPNMPSRAIGFQFLFVFTWKVPSLNNIMRARSDLSHCSR